MQEDPNQGVDTVETTLLPGYTLAANLENLTYTGTGNFTGNGNAAQNVLRGNSGADTLNGGGSNDTLEGGGGDDSLLGSGGNDVLSGGAGSDSLISDAGNDVFAFGAGFGSDQVLLFDSNPAGGQDRLDVSALGGDQRDLRRFGGGGPGRLQHGGHRGGRGHDHPAERVGGDGDPADFILAA